MKDFKNKKEDVIIEELLFDDVVEEPIIEEEEEFKMCSGKVIGGVLNLRSDASKDSEVITKLDDGFELTVLEKGEEWLKVLAGDNEGFVMSKFVEVNEE